MIPDTLHLHLKVSSDEDVAHFLNFPVRFGLLYFNKRKDKVMNNKKSCWKLVHA